MAASELYRLPAPDHPSERIAVRLALPTPDRATGPAVLYLHGFGSSQDGRKAEFFRAAATAAGRPFCSFDFRGHGASGGTMARLGLARNFADTAAVLAHLAERGHARPALFGSSMGGATALWYAALHPGSVRSVLAIAPAVDLAARIERDASPDDLAAWRRRGTTRVATDRGSWDLGWSFYTDARDHPPDELARHLHTPALLFQGARDKDVSPDAVAAFARACPAATLRLFPAGDHRLLDHLPTIWDEAQEFLRRPALNTPGMSTPGEPNEPLS